MDSANVDFRTLGDARRRIDSALGSRLAGWNASAAGFGVRDGRETFIVYVDNPKLLKKVRSKLSGHTIDGIPVTVESSAVRRMADLADAPPHAAAVGEVAFSPHTRFSASIAGRILSTLRLLVRAAPR